MSDFSKKKEILKSSINRLHWGKELKKIKEQFEEVIHSTSSMAAFSTGNLSHVEIEAIFNSLPVELTFVDKEDIVRYFSQTKERIFTRTQAVIGRKVQQCHPQKSLRIVNQILEDFKSGRRNVAEFWIHLDGKLIYIRYLPVRNEKGGYLGCLEVTQDITSLKSIEGEKRLLS
jgi:PAS domain S-box-containing protein